MLQTDTCIIKLIGNVIKQIEKQHQSNILRMLPFQVTSGERLKILNLTQSFKAQDKRKNVHVTAVHRELK